MVYPSNIQYIKDTEPLLASVVNRPTKQLTNRTDHLRKTLDAVSAGEALVLRDVPVGSETAVGTPVYWDASESCFLPACASASRRCDAYALDAASDCMGLVFVKHTAESADILIYGVANLPEIRNFIPSGTGRFYLGASPGTLTLAPPLVQCQLGVLMGPQDVCDDAVHVYVNPLRYGKLFSHTHFSHTLDKAKWSAASNFASAPTGAVYGYQVSQDTDLNAVFPPIPLDACSCTIDWDGNTTAADPITETFGGRDIPVNVTNGILQVNADGIWWMRSDLTPTESDNNTANAPYRGFRVTIHFSRIQHGIQDTLVTSLRPDDGQPFQFVDCSGQEAATGDLRARFTLASSSADTTNLTGKALQKVDSAWVQQSVPVIHGVRSLNSSLSVSGTSFMHNGQTFYGGTVTLNASPYSADYELKPQVVKLSEALESEYLGITYLALPYSRTSSLTMKMEVPGTFGSPLKVKMRFYLLSRIAGTYPNLQLKYIRIPRPGSEAISLEGRTSPTAVALNTAVTTAANTVFGVESAEIEVEEGDVLIWTVKREASSAFAADAAIIRAAGILNVGGDA